MATRRYFQSLEKWTVDRDDAYDFGLISRAMKIAHKLRIPGLELVLSFEDREPVTDTPFEKFLRELTPTRPRHREGRKCQFA